MMTKKVYTRISIKKDYYKKIKKDYYKKIKKGYFEKG